MAAARVHKLAVGESSGEAECEDGAPQGADDSRAAPARGAKRRRTLAPELREAWRLLCARAEAVERQLGRAVVTDGADGTKAAPVFAFVEGALVSALRDGTWLLLDEVNLAPLETLERLASVMEVRPRASRCPGGRQDARHAFRLAWPCTAMPARVRGEPLASRHSPPHEHLALTRAAFLEPDISLRRGTRARRAQRAASCSQSVATSRRCLATRASVSSAP